MKRILTTIQEKANKILLLTILAGAITSCDSILEYNEGDCSTEYCIKFKYDYNMEEVDVFAQQVRTVTLYAFDDNNNLVYQNTDQGEPLGDDNYSMIVDQDLSKYHLVVWAGLNDESFAVPLLYPKQSQIEELKVRTLRQALTRSSSEEEKGKYIVQQELHSLWHGEISNAATTRSGRQQITTVPLVKNTNNIRIVVAQVNTSDKAVTKALTEETFECAIYDDNGYMNYDNTLLEDNLLTYKPFVVEPEVVTSRAFSGANEPAKEYNSIVSEISVARIMESQTPELIIKNSKTQEPLFQVPNLVKYLEKLQLEKYKDRNYTLQEYLDREDNFSMIVFVDENLALIKTVVDVNDWIIQINDIHL